MTTTTLGKTAVVCELRRVCPVRQFDAKTVIVDVNVLVLVEVDGFGRI
jgi:hypothetical protein